MKDVPPPPNKKQSSDGDKSEERYEEPFEIQKARQDQARAVPEMDETAFYGTAGAIAKKLSAVTEADERALLVGLLVGCGSIIGRTAYYKVGSTKHFCNEFACFVGQTGKARKGTTTDFIEETLRLIDENWHSHCVAYGLSSGEGLIELVSDEIRKRVKVKPLKGVPPGPVKFEEQIIKEGVKDKRKLCLSPEFGEFLVVSTRRDGNTINFVVRNCFDGKRLEVNTKQQPQRATDAHISILANITRDELLKLVPFLPSTTGFCNRFLWCVIERKRRVPDGGPSPAECVPQEIDALRKIIRKVPPEKFEIKFSPEAKAVWEGDKDQENGIYDYLDRDGVPDIVTRGVAHVARLATLYALLDGSRVIELCHLNAALVVWRYCEICAIRLFGAEELEREAQLTLDYLRSKGSEGATRTEIWNRVFHNHRTGAEIHNWLCALKEKQLARYETEKNDNGNVIERWFATQCSGPSPDKPPQSSKKTQKKDKTKSSSAFRANPRGNEFARIRTNSQPLRIRQSAPRADSRTNSPNSQLPAHKNSEKSSSESAHPHCEATPVKDSADSQGLLHPFIAPKSRGFVYKNSKKSSWESVNLVHLSREAAPVKDSTGSKTETGPNFSCSTPANSANSANSFREAAPVKETEFANRCEFVANSYLYVTKKAQIPEILASLNGASSIALDTETSNDELRLIQLCDGSNPPVILDVPAPDIKTALVEFLRDRELIIQNSKFDFRVLKDALGMEIPIAHVFDTYIASAVLTNTKVTEELKKQRRRIWQPNSLVSIAQRTIGRTLDKTFQDADWSVDLSLPENEPMLAYAANDVRYMHAIRLHLEGDLEGQNLRAVYELERDLVPCVNAMSEAGVCLDIEGVYQRAKEALELTAQREAVVLSLLKRKINLRSRKAQLLPALQDLGITFQGEKLTSTDKKILPLVDQKNHPVIAAVLEWSSVNEEAKQLAQWPKWMDEKNIVRPKINQLGTVTGRFTYSEPNLQQVKKSALRSIIVAPPGHLILRSDFKTIEIILAAVHYNETFILEQISAGADLHTVTASTLFHCSLEAVTKPQREMAKTTNFSLLYGRSLESYITACRLAGITDSAEELERIYHDFDKAWPNWAAYKAQIFTQISRRTYPREVRSMYGRRIILDPSLSNREIRGALLNYPIQSTGSDELKLTMINVWQENPRGFRLLASIHDEILAVLKPGRVEYAKALLREAAADAARRLMQNDIPIPLEIGVGKNWWEAIQDKEEEK